MLTTIKQKNVYIAGIEQLYSDSAEYHERSKNNQNAMKIVTGRNNPNETPVMKIIYGLKKD